MQARILPTADGPTGRLVESVEYWYRAKTVKIRTTQRTWRSIICRDGDIVLVWVDDRHPVTVRLVPQTDEDRDALAGQMWATHNGFEIVVRLSPAPEETAECLYRSKE